MPDSPFVARIAELLQQHSPVRYAPYRCGCGHPLSAPYAKSHHAHVAEVLVASLHTQEAEEKLARIRVLAESWFEDYDTTPANDPRSPSEMDQAYDDAGFQILFILNGVDPREEFQPSEPAVKPCRAPGRKCDQLAEQGTIRALSVDLCPAHWAEFKAWEES